MKINKSVPDFIFKSTKAFDRDGCGGDRNIKGSCALTHYCPTYFQSTGRDLIYITGPERDSLFGIDSEWLLIWLDENGIYKRHAIVTD